jgi:hypothetical protein
MSPTVAITDMYDKRMRCKAERCVDTLAVLSLSMPVNSELLSIISYLTHTKATTPILDKIVNVEACQ